MPVIPRNVAGHLINFVVGDSVVWPPVCQAFPFIPPDTRDFSEVNVGVTFPDSEEFHRGNARLQMTATELSTGIDALVGALLRMPDAHLAHISKCPILITTNLPSGLAAEHGGYYLPLDATPNPVYTVRLWMDRVDRTHVQFPPTDLAVNFDAGVIAITTLNLKARPIGSHPRCQFTILHEAGHCIDYNGDPANLGHGLDSDPEDDSYRLGNHAYQGQRYLTPGPAREGETEESRLLPLPRRIYEFKAETYSRLLMGCTSLCRQNEATPACILGPSGHRGCNCRLQLDLAHSAAFRRLLTFLPLAAAELRTTEASAR